jgi:guanosine-3',5'-bis(diphosphate) 3'-pyrophosphohydrolase
METTVMMTLRLERAMRWAAQSHHGQTRRNSQTPYFEHVAAVALVLVGAGFDEDVVIAGLLHDLVEDTAVTLDDVTTRFGTAVAELVRHCSEVKIDAAGKKRPWIDRKRDHLAALALAPFEARAIILADKLHNLISIELDIEENRPVWSEFHAERSQVIWYYHTTIDRCGHGDRRLESLARSCHEVLARIEALNARSGPL